MIFLILSFGALIGRILGTLVDKDYNNLEIKKKSYFDLDIHILAKQH